MVMRITALCFLFPLAVQAGVSADVALVSDYRSYGISQTEKGPAVQLALDYDHKSGVYLGTWASNVDYGEGDDTRLEWDFYGGIFRQLNPVLGLDLGYAWYSYSGTDYSADYNYGELVVGLTLYDNTSVYWYHASDFSGAGVAHDVLKLSHLVVLGKYSLAFTLAHNESDDKNTVSWDENKSSYQYAEVAIAREFHGLTLAAAIMATTIDTDYNDNADPALVVSVSRGFDLIP